MTINYYSKEDLPSGFKKGKCKCGRYYAYCGADLGYCIKCLDAMEETQKTSHTTTAQPNTKKIKTPDLHEESTAQQ